MKNKKKYIKLINLHYDLNQSQGRYIHKIWSFLTGTESAEKKIEAISILTRNHETNVLSKIHKKIKKTVKKIPSNNE